MRKALTFVLMIIILFGCSIEDFLSHQITQYIAIKRGTGGYDVERALRDGVSEEEIARYLAKTRNFDLDKHLRAGFTHREIIDYLASQPRVDSEQKTEASEKKPRWKPHKIVLKVYPDKQEVVYWIEGKDSKERSPLYKMRNCVIADSDNWQGQMDYHPSIWPTKIAISNPLDIREVFKDPKFHALPMEERRKFMAKIDPDFAGLPVAEQDKFLNKITSLQESISGFTDNVGKKIEVIDGKLKLDGLELPKVGWWKWNFDKKSFQGSEIISTTWFVWNNNLIWILSGIGILLIILFGWHSDIEEKKRKRKEAEEGKNW